MRVILVIVIVLLTVLTITGVFYEPATVGPDFLDSTGVAVNPVCSEEAVPCLTDGDCASCQDGDVFEMKCQELRGRRYCLPKTADQPCNTELGGQWVWTGWADSGNKEWECLCTYPEIAGNKGCTKLNPNVCKGGKYRFSKNSTTGPVPEDCECPTDTIRIVTEGNVPMCIKKNKTSCRDETTCRQFYSTL